VKLLDMLRNGELDVAILAEPFPEHGLAIAPLYDEPFVVAVPQGHRLAQGGPVSSTEIRDETMLLLGTGHCFRDHVLEVCPEFARFSPASDGIRRSFEGSSLETIKHMVASGMGITILPRMSAPPDLQQTRAAVAGQICYVPFRDPVPSRRVVLAWRKSFTRLEAIRALQRATDASDLPGVTRIDASTRLTPPAEPASS
jgi:LysR family hydrogen peroxide-inducible transcriptional activator